LYFVLVDETISDIDLCRIAIYPLLYFSRIKNAIVSSTITVSKYVGMLLLQPNFVIRKAQNQKYDSI